MSKDEAINVSRDANLTEQKWNIIKHKNVFSCIKMGNGILTFGDIEIEKYKFYCFKSHIF